MHFYRIKVIAPFVRLVGGESVAGNGARDGIHIATLGGQYQGIDGAAYTAGSGESPCFCRELT